MRNVRFTVRTAEGVSEVFHRENSGRDLIRRLTSDAWSRQPCSLAIEATTDDHRIVRITIPYDHLDRAHVSVEYAAPFQTGDRVRILHTGALGIVLWCGIEGPVYVRVADVAYTLGLSEVRLE
jgi:hypothetical protein